MNRATTIGILGVLAPGAGLATSLTSIELGLRIASLAVGTAVGLLSGASLGISLYKRLKSKK